MNHLSAHTNAFGLQNEMILDPRRVYQGCGSTYLARKMLKSL